MAAPGFAPARSDPVRRGLRSIRRRLPDSGGIPEDAWHRRHRGILTLLWFHVPAILLFGLYQGARWDHVLLGATTVAAFAAFATQLAHRRTLSTVLASTGLVTASAVIVHLSGGVIEAHFHFFVMVGVVVLYQEWWPFLVAIAYVVLHHGTLGTVYPYDVYNHAAAIENPWKWAGVHGGFILAMSCAGIATWRLNESLRNAAVASERHLAEAQQLTHIGSWELDLQTGNVVSSDEFKRMFGFSEVEEPTVECFLERINAEDSEQLARWMDDVRHHRSSLGLNLRVRGDGQTRWVHCRTKAVVDETGAGHQAAGDDPGHHRAEGG